jgi:hypothetical protein
MFGLKSLDAKCRQTSFRRPLTRLGTRQLRHAKSAGWRALLVDLSGWFVRTIQTVLGQSWAGNAMRVSERKTVARRSIILWPTEMPCPVPRLLSCAVAEIHQRVVRRQAQLRKAARVLFAPIDLKIKTDVDDTRMTACATTTSNTYAGLNTAR